MAKEQFAITGLDPSYAHLMLLLCDNPGLSQNEIASLMNLKPSTITRFLDKLLQKGLIEKEQHGRNYHISPTDLGIEKSKLIRESLYNLYTHYCEVLGKDFALKLTSDINKANQIIEK